MFYSICGYFMFRNISLISYQYLGQTNEKIVQSMTAHSLVRIIFIIRYSLTSTFHCVRVLKQTRQQ